MKDGLVGTLRLLSADEEIKVKSFLKWGLIAFVGLAVLGALLGDDEKAGESPGSASADAAGTRAPTAPEPSTAEPPPDPEVSVSYTGPSTVQRDNVVLKGTVDPANARVRVERQSVEVRGGHWKLPVTLTKHGENNFRIVATRKGYVDSSTMAVVRRELSAAEQADIRRERAARRANRRALESAESYVELSGFSKQGLYQQLSSSAGEGFTETEAQYAVDHVGADWNKEAVESAESYLALSGFSQQGLYEQLTSSAGDGFTPAEAQYALDHVDANWNKEAVESARSYLEISPMSRDALIDQLSSSAGDGFTYEQALYAVNRVY